MAFAPKQRLSYNPLLYRTQTARPMAQDLQLKMTQKIRVQGPVSGDSTKMFQQKQRIDPPKQADYKLFQHEIKKNYNIQNVNTDYMSNCQSERQLFSEKRRIQGPVAQEQKLFNSKYQVPNPISEKHIYEQHKQLIPQQQSQIWQYQQQKRSSQFSSQYNNHNSTNNLTEIIFRSKQDDSKNNQKLFQSKSRIIQPSDIKDIISQQQPQQKQNIIQPTQQNQMKSILTNYLTNTRPEKNVNEKIQNITMHQSCYLLTDVNNFRKCEIGTNQMLKK